MVSKKKKERNRRSESPSNSSGNVPPIGPPVGSTRPAGPAVAFPKPGSSSFERDLSRSNSDNFKIGMFNF